MGRKPRNSALSSRKPGRPALSADNFPGCPDVRRTAWLARVRPLVSARCGDMASCCLAHETRGLIVTAACFVRDAQIRQVIQRNAVPDTIAAAAMHH